MTKTLTTNLVDTAARYWPLCLECAKTIHAAEPTPEYARSVASLLLATGAQESEFVAQRQHGFALAPFDSRGAFGIWQVERATLSWLLEWLKTQPALQAAATAWIGESKFAYPLEPSNVDRLLVAIQQDDGDRIDCLFARIRYLLAPGLVPAAPAAQAWYWLKYYNGKGATKKYAAQGKAVEESAVMAAGEFLEKWYSICVPAINAAEMVVPGAESAG